MLIRMRIRWVAVCLTFVTGLIGCAGGPGAKPGIQIRGSIEASADLNPDFDGRPSPVVIRVYQLSSSSSFQDTEFFALYDNEIANLGQSLVGLEEFEIQPAESREYNTELNVATRYLGVIAAFRDLDNAQWQALLELPDQKKVPVTIKLESLKITVATDER